MKRSRKLKGLYLVVMPILPVKDLLFATESALEGGVDLLEFSSGQLNAEMRHLARALVELSKKYVVPSIVNNSLELAKEVDADGVHFDLFNVSPTEARRTLGRELIVGYTVNFDLGKVKWAEREGADYVSFCSVFHQCSGVQCPIVSLETVRNAASTSSLSVFAAGGIKLENVHLVLEAGVNGVAVTSAILKSKDPKQIAMEFKEIINRYNKKSN